MSLAKPDRFDEWLRRHRNEVGTKPLNQIILMYGQPISSSTAHRICQRLTARGETPIPLDGVSRLR